LFQFEHHIYIRERVTGVKLYVLAYHLTYTATKLGTNPPWAGSFKGSKVPKGLQSIAIAQPSSKVFALMSAPLVTFDNRQGGAKLGLRLFASV